MRSPNFVENAMRYLIGTALAAALLSPVAYAQTMSGVAQTNVAGETTTVFSIQPQRQVSASDYVKLSADALNYRIAASQLALRKATRRQTMIKQRNSGTRFLPPSPTRIEKSPSLR
jgi:hypothetical protein